MTVPTTNGRPVTHPGQPVPTAPRDLEPVLLSGWPSAGPSGPPTASCHACRRRRRVEELLEVRVVADGSRFHVCRPQSEPGCFHRVVESRRVHEIRATTPPDLEALRRLVDERHRYEVASRRERGRERAARDTWGA